MPVLLVCSVTDTPGINIPSRCHRGKRTLLGVGEYCLNLLGVMAFTLFFYLLGFSEAKGIQAYKKKHIL